MSKDIELAAPQAVTQWDAPEMIRTLKDTVCKGATDSQFRMFVEVCKNTGLNPFLKEIYFVPNVGVMAGRDGYLRVANADTNFDGMETRVDRDEKNVPIKATCTVWRKDRSHPIICEAYYSEYRKSSQVWNTYPSAMISKVAEVLALKRSFAINGVVTEEEIGEQQVTGSREAQAEVRDRKLTAINAIPPAGPALAPERIIELVNELEAPLPIPDPPKAKSGTITFDGLKKLGEMKPAIRAITGTDALYYDALKVAGVAHANQLNTKDGRDVWKALALIQQRLSADAALRKGVEELALQVGPNKFAEILGANGFADIDEFIANASGDSIDTVQRELKQAIADAMPRE